MLNAQIRDEVAYCAAQSVRTLTTGNLTGLRENNDKGAKTNQKIHNFFQYDYRSKRYKTTAEEYDIRMDPESEAYTSKTCSLCGVRHRNGRKHRGLYQCKPNNTILNADVNGSENQLQKVSPSPELGRSSRAMTRPTVPQQWNKHTNQWEPRISPPSGGRVSKVLLEPVGCSVENLVGSGGSWESVSGATDEVKLSRSSARGVTVSYEIRLTVARRDNVITCSVQN
jgi:hypothetical protein